MTSLSSPLQNRISPEVAGDNVWRIKSPHADGPTVAIIGGIHGNERAGTNVVDAMVREGVALTCGELLLIRGNPAAIEENERYLEENLNRCFRDLTEEEAATPVSDWSLELRRAQYLIPFLQRCSSVLDLHELISDKADGFIICERPALQTAQALGAPIISFGWSKTEAGGTDGYMYENNKEGVCYELGHYTDTEKNTRLGMQVVDRYLAVRGLVDAEFEPLFKRDRTRYIQTIESHLAGESGFIFNRSFKSFERLEAGCVVGVFGDGRRLVATGNDRVIIFPNRDAGPSDEVCTIGRDITSQLAVAA